MARDFHPITLITPYHVAACSVVSAFRTAGYSVCAPQWVHVDDKLRAIRGGHGADLIWAHWTWCERLPAWVWDRRVVTILRDPMECAISDYLRGNSGKAVAQARQWLNAWRRRKDVDQWLDFRALRLSRYGIDSIPHENATPSHPLKTAYKARDFRPVRTAMQRQWDCLMVIRREVLDLFALAGLSRRMEGTALETMHR